MRWLAGGVAAVSLLLGLAATPAVAEDFRFRMAGGHPPTVFYTIMMSRYFVPALEKRIEALGHRVSVEASWGGSLLSASQTLEGVRDGVADIGGLCVCLEPEALLLNNYPLWMPFDMPEAVAAGKLGRAVHDANPALREAYLRNGQVLLSLYPTQNFALWTSFAWESLEDLRGRKIAGAGPAALWVRKVGAEPVAAALPNFRDALANGTWDGMVMFPFDGIGLRLHEATRRFTVVDFGAKPILAVTINRAVFEGLPEPVRMAMVEAGREVEVLSGAWQDAALVENMKLLSGSLDVAHIRPDVKQAWAAALADYPAEKAREAEALGVPARDVMRFAVEEAERLGHRWPIRYRFE
ncbi:MAG: hypothetical protein AB7N54_16035 [Alphaproteobacteria bacterium]